QLMGVFFHQDAVVERARFRLISVDAQINRAGMLLGQKRPLQPGRKPRTSSAAQPGLLDLVDDVDRLFFLEDALERLIAAVLTIAVEPVAIRLVDARQEDRFVWHGSLFNFSISRSADPPSRA